MHNIYLYHGDCLDVMDGLIAKGVKFDAIICDPPYGTTQCKFDVIIPFEPMWERLYKLRRNAHTPIVLFGSEPFSSLLRVSNINHYKYDWIYRKTTATGHLNAKRQPLMDNETISVFYEKQCLYNPQKTTGHKRKVSTAKHKRNCVITQNYNEHGLTTYDSTERYPKTVVTFKTDKQKSTLHPQQKPLELMEYLIKTYTNEGDSVLDFAIGSGTTGVGCKKLNRYFTGIEKDKKHFNTAENRIR